MHTHTTYTHAHTHYRGGPSSRNLVDMAVLVMRYPAATDLSEDITSISLPISCAIASGSHIQSQITCTGFLEPGGYAILPLAFSHWQPPAFKPQLSTASRGKPRRESEDRGAIPYVMALFSAREVSYFHVHTRPGFLSESLFLLAERHGKTSEVSPPALVG